MSIIYLDNAATTPLSPAVLEEMMPYLKDQCGNPSSNHSLGIKARKAKEAARERVASLINAQPDEIFFTSGATESNNWMLSAVSKSIGSIGLSIVGIIEHASIINAAKEYLPDSHTRIQGDINGVISQKHLEMFFDFSKLMKYPFVSISMANNEIGTVNDIMALSKIAHDNNSLFHTDATQALGHMKIDVKSMGIDALSASAHKIYGPKGIGFLYAKKDTLLYSAIKNYRLIVGGHQESGLRAGTENIPGIVGFGAACEETQKWLESGEESRLNALKKELYEGLISDEIGAISNVDVGVKSIPTLSMRFSGINNQELVQLLDEDGICVSTGSACNEGTSVSSHVLEGIGLEEKEISETVRFSIGRNNTKEEIQRTIECVSCKVKMLRMIIDE